VCINICERDGGLGTGALLFFFKKKQSSLSYLKHPIKR
jgi:hypothetical protein